MSTLTYADHVEAGTFISRKTLQYGRGWTEREVVVKADIDVSKELIVKYADNGNGHYGGDVTELGGDHVHLPNRLFRVRIYTD